MRKFSFRHEIYFGHGSMSSSRSQPSGNSYTSAANVEDYHFTLFVVRWLVAFPGLWRSAAVDANIVQGNGWPNVFDRVGDCTWASFFSVHVSLIRITCHSSTHLTSIYFQPAKSPNPPTRIYITFKDMDSTLAQDTRCRS